MQLPALQIPALQLPHGHLPGDGEECAQKVHECVETEPGSFLLMDCGKGTASQLVRSADHHLGLINIIQHRERAFIFKVPITRFSINFSEYQFWLLDYIIWISFWRLVKYH